MNKSELVCSWCQAEAMEEPKPGQSHGICPRHAREFLNGHRPDQVRFSLYVWLGIFALLTLSGFCIASWLAWFNQ